MKHEEDNNQAALFKYASLQPDPVWQVMFSIPNGGKRPMSTAKRLKATGLKAGIPDIFFPVGRGIHNGLFIEMKSSTGRVSPLQAEWHTKLRDQCYIVEVCHSSGEAIDVITRYLESRFKFMNGRMCVHRTPEGRTQT